MKTRVIFALFFLALQVVNADTVLGPYTSNWSVDRTTTLSGINSSDASSSTSTFSNLLLPFYNGSEALKRVQIIYIAPLTGNGTISASLSNDSGTTHFTDASVGVDTEIGSTTLYNGLHTIDPLDALTFKVNTGSKTAGWNQSASDSVGAFTLNNPNVYNFSDANLTRSYNTSVFDSTNASVLSYFSQSGNFGFTLYSSVQAQYDRDVADNGSLTFTYTGIDSGTVEVIYTTVDPVPEPATVGLLLGGAGMLLLGQRLRRRSA